MSIKTSTPNNVTAATSSTQLFAAAEAALAEIRIIVNDSTSILYVKWGTAASATSFTYKVLAGDTLEFPRGRNGDIYTGVVHGIWVAANGAARVTEAY